MSVAELEQIEPAPPIEYTMFRQLEPPKEVFFYERVSDQFSENTNEYAGIGIGDSPQGAEKIFACSEQEAAWLHRNENKGKYRQIGHSDGKTYYDVIKNSGLRPGSRVPIQQVRELLQKAFQAELEVARGKLKEPRLRTVITDGTVPEYIRRDLEHGQRN